MQIVDARDLTIPLTANIANSVVSFASHTVSLVALISDQMRAGRPVVGLAFNSIGRFGQSGLLRERLFPRLLAAEPDVLVDHDGDAFDPARVAACVMANEKPGGHGDRCGAVAAIEMAIWDLNAKLSGQPCWQLIAEVEGRAAAAARSTSIETYAAGGYYFDQRDDVADLDALRAELEGYVGLGYLSGKIKIGGASLEHDLRRIDVAAEVFGDASRVAVDANGRFDEPMLAKYCRRLRGLGLRWFEEPCDPLEFALCRQAVETYGGAVATGENLFSRQDVLNLLRYGGLRPGVDILQMDPGLSYGITELRSTLGLLEAAGFDRTQSHPHGGQLLNLHVVAGLGLGGCEAYPGVFAPVGGFSPDCVLREGRVALPEAMGFGLEAKPELAPFIEELLT
ncbi:MAG: mandelate racemase [Pseudomonadaceae bacterium]|nr:mandelate racemase [Pseudomonadaceae bacterium]